MDEQWLRRYAAELAPTAPRDSPVRWVQSGSGARLAFVAGLVVKWHPDRTDRERLERRVAAVRSPALRDLFVPPLGPVVTAPGSGRPVTAWPEVSVLAPGDVPLPWAEAGALLARLHQVRIQSLLAGPRQDGSSRLRRAVARARRVGGPDGQFLARLGAALLREVAEAGAEREAAQRHTDDPASPERDRIIHGDWHLGQLGHWHGGWRLLDLDDLGVGDPALDLARPAGFWAAGLLDDDSWERFLGAYRRAGGPAVPAAGDPWPRLDLPARCAVLVAAVRALADPAGEAGTATALLSACRKM